MLSLAADQRQEKTGVVKTRVPINSIALCPLHPHLFATGGGDAIGMRDHLPLASICALADVLANVRCSALCLWFSVVLEIKDGMLSLSKVTGLHGL